MDKRTPRISNEAVARATHKTWDDWFAFLDVSGASDMQHKEIAQLLRNDFDVNSWWAQSIAVQYEYVRGLRDKHQMPDGYQISASKTISAPLALIFDYWTDETKRQGWLGQHKVEIRHCTEDKSLRISWLSDDTHLDVYVYASSSNKTRLQINHRRIEDSQTADDYKAFWKQRLAELDQLLNS